ncbi:hypothetical protein BD410DRAFT_787892 [Rickenella mellea]|uniref:Uncharacterized protein n=1 Tax=Rickenella mellea TaxID=50990 RepID=A0A4Y7Q666_9AGAM|nr:hypothetical protein BD410DRAFT_787892 [Rickenella mellea]
MIEHFQLSGTARAAQLPATSICATCNRWIESERRCTSSMYTHSHCLAGRITLSCAAMPTSNKCRVYIHSHRTPRIILRAESDWKN